MAKGPNATVAAIESSSRAYIASGDPARSARFPHTALPLPNPAMNTAKTADDAAVEAPNTRRNSRNQATWKISPQAPESTSSPATAASGAGAAATAGSRPRGSPSALARRSGKGAWLNVCSRDWLAILGSRVKTGGEFRVAGPERSEGRGPP